MDIVEYRELHRYKYQLTKYKIFQTDIYGYDVVTQDGFVALNSDGELIIAERYASDEPSGPTCDTVAYVKGSLPYDTGYQVIREGLLPFGPFSEDYLSVDERVYVPKFRHTVGCKLFNFLLRKVFRPVDVVHLVIIVPIGPKNQSFLIKILIELCPRKRCHDTESSSRHANLPGIHRKIFDLLLRLIREPYHKGSACTPTVLTYVLHCLPVDFLPETGCFSDSIPIPFFA